MSPWCVVLVCNWRHLLAGRHSLPFPWILSLQRWWCPSASNTLCPSSSLTYLSLSTSVSFPLVRCANGAPRISLFHCSVSGPHRGGQQASPLARRVQALIPNRR